jgi:hypothetical protein
LVYPAVSRAMSVFHHHRPGGSSPVRSYKNLFREPGREAAAANADACFRVTRRFLTAQWPFLLVARRALALIHLRDVAPRWAAAHA